MDDFGGFDIITEKTCKMGKKTINGLPVFEARMTSKKCGVLRVSFVDNPAVESDFIAYDKQERKALYKISDEDKQRVFGCVLRADYPIYRRDKDNGEYYITFAADEIRAFAQKYLAESKQNNVDLEHDGTEIEGAEMVQYFIKDSAGGVAPEGFDEVADGSLFAEYQITDADLWERIKSGEFHGFSVEIIHAVLPAEYQQIKKENMRKSVLAKAKELLAQIVAEEENEMSAQNPANENPEQGKEQEYKAYSTDKGIVRIEGDELAEGVLAYGEDADGNQTTLEDGDYRTADNKIIVVKDGKVAEVKDAPIEAKPATEPTAEPEQDNESAQTPAEPASEPEKNEFREKCSKMSASYDQKRKSIYEAIAKVLPFSYYYLYECGDDFAVVEAEDNNYQYHYFRYAIKWDGEEAVVDGEGVEGRIGFIPNTSADYAAEKAQMEQEHKDALAAKDAEIADLKAKLEAPAGQSAHDAYRAKKGTYAGANPIEDAMAYLK